MQNRLIRKYKREKINITSRAYIFLHVLQTYCYTFMLQNDQTCGIKNTPQSNVSQNEETLSVHLPVKHSPPDQDYLAPYDSIGCLYLKRGVMR